MNSNLRLLCSYAIRPKRNRTKRIRFSRIERKDKKTKQSNRKQNKTTKNMFAKSWKINFYLSDFSVAAFYFGVYRCFLFIAIQNLFFSTNTLRNHSAVLVGLVGCEKYGAHILAWRFFWCVCVCVKAFVYSFNVKNNTPLMCCSTYFHHYPCVLCVCVCVWYCLWIYFVLVCWPSSWVWAIIERI